MQLILKPAGAVVVLVGLGLLAYYAVHRPSEERSAAPPADVVSASPSPKADSLITSVPNDITGTIAKITPFDLKDLPGKSGVGYRIMIVHEPKSIWDVGLSSLTTVPVTKGEHLEYSVWARSATVPFTDIKFELNDAPYTRSFLEKISLTPEWKEYKFPFTSIDSYPPAGAAARFHCGYGVGEVDVADMRITQAP